jgi:hypothetical protein
MYLNPLLCKENFMIILKEIQEYVGKTANIISSVLDMEVIICDINRCLLGDSNPDWSPQSKMISNNSILTKVMAKGMNILLILEIKMTGVKSVPI